VQLRGGEGVFDIIRLTTFKSILQGLWSAISLDWGHLHPIAMALSLPPGEVSADGFLNILNIYGILNKLIDYRATSVGEWIASTMGLIEGRPWGFHASLFGSLYLYGGLQTVLLGSTIFGLLLSKAYQLCISGKIAFQAIGAIVIVRSIFGVYIAEPINLAGMTSDIVTVVLLLAVANFWHQATARAVGGAPRTWTKYGGGSAGHME
jgi:hypothetical protein